MTARTFITASTLLCAIALSASAQAFPHVVRKGETLASIAERIYGKIQFERILVAANALEAQGGVPIVPGMRLEVPAVSYHQVRRGETWAGLAEQLLGDEQRSDVLSMTNGSSPWLTPEEGARILVPYNLRIIATGDETLLSLAYKYLGDRKKAWTLSRYNQLKDSRIRRGAVVLIPLVQLPLTEAGKREAAAASSRQCSEAGGDTLAVQRRVQAEMPALLTDIRTGRYVDAVARGVGFLAAGELSKPQQAIVYRQLLTAYAALGALGRAAASCAQWLRLDPAARLDERSVSPKLLAACRQAQANPKRAPAVTAASGKPAAPAASGERGK